MLRPIPIPILQYICVHNKKPTEQHSPRLGVE